MMLLSDGVLTMNAFDLRMLLLWEDVLLSKVQYAFVVERCTAD